MKTNIRKYILPDWWNEYNKTLGRGDTLAGLTVGIMLIPQGMAYSDLAGLSPIFGLYASLLPVMVYGIWGSNQKLAVGPAALTAILVASSVSSLAETGTQEYVSLVALLSFLVGICYWILLVLRLEKLVKYLTIPVTKGFAAAGGFMVFVSQLKYILGVDFSKKENIFATIFETIKQIPQLNIATFIISTLALFLLIQVPKWKRNIPIAFLVILMSIITVYFFQLDKQGVAIIKDVPSGLPQWSFPHSISWTTIFSLLPDALILTLFGFAINMSVAKIFAEEDKNYTYSPRKELIVMGLSNLASGWSGSFPVNGALSRTMVNDQAGAKTGVALIVSAGIILLTLLFLTPLFYYLPKAILATIIMVAVLRLMRWRDVVGLYHQSKWDLLTYLVTFAGVLVVGIKWGIMVGIGFSLLLKIFNKNEK